MTKYNRKLVWLWSTQRQIYKKKDTNTLMLNRKNTSVVNEIKIF